MEDGRGERRRAETVHALFFPEYEDATTAGPHPRMDRLRGGARRGVKALEEVRQKGTIGNPLKQR